MKAGERLMQVFDVVILHDAGADDDPAVTTIAWEGRVLARDLEQARLLGCVRSQLPEATLAASRVLVRPFS